MASLLRTVIQETEGNFQEFVAWAISAKQRSAECINFRGDRLGPSHARRDHNWGSEPAFETYRETTHNYAVDDVRSAPS